MVACNTPSGRSEGREEGRKGGGREGGRAERGRGGRRGYVNDCRGDVPI